MNAPKLHHYVPRFYLARFADSSNQFWCWSKETGSVFRSNPSGVAAEKHFYRIPEFIGTDTDPLVLERDLAQLESRAAEITVDWASRLAAMNLGNQMPVSADERSALSAFIAVQFLRTAEQREILALHAMGSESYSDGVSDPEKINLHAYMLYSGGLVEQLTQRIIDSIWVIARNASSVPLWTSDNPVAFKTGDNRMWLNGPGILSVGSYAVYPLTPRYVLYIKEPTHWQTLKRFDCCLSPVELTQEMVEHENAGQVFMATRFVVSSSPDFAFADEFVKSIGTDMYAPKDA